MNHKHKLKVAHWVNGLLSHHERSYDSYDEALEESKKYIGIIKIYNELGLLVHQLQQTESWHCDHESYA